MDISEPEHNPSEKKGKVSLLATASLVTYAATFVLPSFFRHLFPGISTGTMWRVLIYMALLLGVAALIQRLFVKRHLWWLALLPTAHVLILLLISAGASMATMHS